MRLHLLFPLLLLTTSFLPAQEAASGFPSHTLANDEVRMVVLLPDVERGAYRATRFDWSGIIASLQYRGHEYFGYWKDTRDPTVHEDLTGPAESYWAPGLGYDEADPGEGFIRIGIGVLEKPEEEAYRPFATYPILDHGKWGVQKKKDRIRFTHTLSSDSGYGYVYTKEIRLTEDQPGFVIDHSLKNTGSKTIETDQYNHNFFMIDGTRTGPDMEVSFPYAVSCENDLKGLVSIDENKFIFNKPFGDESVWMELEGYGTTAADHQFTVRNKKTGAGVAVRMDRPLHRMTFWAIDRTLCPENCLLIRVAPGETFTWEATYTLFTE